MNMRTVAGLALAASVLAVGAANATTMNFAYKLAGVDQATGSFSYATGSTGVLGYGDLTAFSLTVVGAGPTYTLADALGMTDYIHFAYDTAANTFLVDTNSCGFSGCGFTTSLSAINSTGTFGYFFTAVPGVFREYTTGATPSMDQLVISPGVPEPATWALMLMGFGAIGYGLRRNKLALAAA